MRSRACCRALPGAAGAHTTEATYTDVDILNYALTLEHLEAAFYNQGFAKFRRAFGNSERKRIQLIRKHENEHVDFLTGALGDQAVPAATYDFKFTGIRRFYATAQLLENTGVSAYDGAIAHISGAENLTYGATIATVEARHAAYLNGLNGEFPFPDSFDAAVAPTDIVDAVLGTGFITGTPEPYGPYGNFQAFVDKLPDTIQPETGP
ncbi:ferritin-like domain-containing protein [Rubrobacter indicoceani]|uniref:ferritin-like domain-containing protein n=1 Tax=Rubrobacter indicoceani TaxID=2051957 RepID=UPI0013C48DA4|nr:ferritin-like domain-containing protein [Rubrobacter indicoceani]